jgi:hypothetical protein
LLKCLSQLQNELSDAANDNPALTSSACRFVKKGGTKRFSCTI